MKLFMKLFIKSTVKRRGSIVRSSARILLASLALLCTASGVAATRPVAYSFAPDDHFLTKSQEYPRWAALTARHAAQMPQIEACLSDVLACPNSLRGYREVVLASHDLSAERKMKLANRFINARRWRIEPRRDDDWRTLEDFLQYGGDCEDFAIAKYFLLRQVGFATDDLRIAITWDREVQDYHAVTLVHLDGEVFILDVDGGPPRGERAQKNYRFLFSINENGIWDHTESPAGSAQRDQPTDHNFYLGEQHI